MPEHAARTQVFCKIGNLAEVLGGLYDLACFDAARTHINFSDATLFDNGTDSLEVRVESSFVQIMGMADIIADHRLFPANCTFF